MSRWGSSALCGNILYIHIYIYHVYTLLYADWKTGRRGVYRTSVAAPEDQRTRKLNPKALEIDLCIATHGYTWLLYSLGIEARRGMAGATPVPGARATMAATGTGQGPFQEAQGFLGHLLRVETVGHLRNGAGHEAHGWHQGMLL